MSEGFEGRGFTPGHYGDAAYGAIRRHDAERLLRSWFVWLADRSRIHFRPAGSHLEAELQIRRWKKRPGLVIFRWRNSTPTRQTFDVVRHGFHAEKLGATIELTPRTRKPRALILSTQAKDVLAPAWAMGLVISAFRYAGADSVRTFDVNVSAHALPEAAAEIPLEPRPRAWAAGFKVGATIRRLVRPPS